MRAVSSPTLLAGLAPGSVRARMTGRSTPPSSGPSACDYSLEPNVPGKLASAPDPGKGRSGVTHRAPGRDLWPPQVAVASLGECPRRGLGGADHLVVRDPGRRRAVHERSGMDR